MAAEVLFLISPLLPWVLSQELSLLWKSLFLGQKESSRSSIMCFYSVFHQCGEKKMGPMLFQEVGRSCLDIQNGSELRSYREADDRVPKHQVSQNTVS